MNDSSGILPATATAGAPGAPGSTAALSSSFPTSSSGNPTYIFGQSVTHLDQSTAAKRRRTAAPSDGCTTCRLRKVKCSGKQAVSNGSCANCARLELACSFVSAEVQNNQGPGKVSRIAPSRDRTEAGTVRKRAQRACRECHAHKTKCSGDLPRCKRCQANELICEYTPSKRKFTHAPGSQSVEIQDDMPDFELRADLPSVEDETKQVISPTTFSGSSGFTPQTRRSSIVEQLYGEDILAKQDIVLRHFDVFFRLWIPLPCMGILEMAPTFIEIEERRLHPIIAAAVCATTAHIVHPGQIRIPFADRCADQVDFYLFRNMDSFLRQDAHENLIILVCAIYHFWHGGQMSKVWMYMGLAARLITALQLNWDGAGESPIKQERNRRLVWVVYILDRLLAGGFDEHLVLRDGDMHIKLPVANDDLPQTSNLSPALQMSMPAGQGGPHQETQKLSLDGYHLRLHRIRHQILGVTKRLASPPTPHPRRPRLEASQVIRLVNGLQNQLISFSQSLPEDLKLSDASISSYINSVDGPSFVMLHTLFWLLHVDLYRFSIPGIREEATAELSMQLPQEFVIKSQKQAVGYAVSLARFWRTLQSHVTKRAPGDGTERLITVDQSFAIYITHTTKILLAARQHRLFSNLEDSTAPLVRQEPVDDATLQALIESNMQLYSPFSYFFPRINEITQDIREAVANFRHNTRSDRPELIGMPAVRAPETVRLPGPHYVLENALVQRESDHDDRERERRRNKSAADIWFRSKKKSHDETPITPPVVVPEAPPVPIMGVPEIPLWLAEARGCDPLPDMPWQEDHTQEGQSWMTSQAGVGIGFGNSYLFDGSWPTSQPGYYDMIPNDPTPGFNQPFDHSGGPPILYERAKGLPSAAVPPALHGGNDRRAVYDRDAGAQLPYPSHIGHYG
ncbi:putative transcriptional regulatory protein PB1A11.04c [Cytospora mali]|uniref:Transcriptional regulatory protein PB1A11.04c n=1 Tax=Cytospora mali TaxID=578113 RepID=A0A194VM34_CYTMA|nr:putative transcriptional regulatory protein PB1A11.04c [Valsa mali]